MNQRQARKIARTFAARFIEFELKHRDLIGRLTDQLEEIEDTQDQIRLREAFKDVIDMLRLPKNAVHRIGKRS